jgi:DnaK suppressor protein
MTASQLAALRKDLLTHLERIVRSVPPSDAQMSQQNRLDPDDEAELALLDELDGIIGELNDREVHLAQELVAALERMRTGTYGRCVDCGQEIPLPRLHAIPWTLRCAEDQDRINGTAHPTL